MNTTPPMVLILEELKKYNVPEGLLDAIRIYEIYGARWDSIYAFESENYHDIAEAIAQEAKVGGK